MNKIEARALLGNQPKYALRNMAKALQMLTLRNTSEDWRRLEALRALGYKVTCEIPGGHKEAKREKARQAGLRAKGRACAAEYIAWFGKGAV